MITSKFAYRIGVFRSERSRFGNWELFGGYKATLRGRADHQYPGSITSNVLDSFQKINCAEVVYFKRLLRKLVRVPRARLGRQMVDMIRVELGNQLGKLLFVGNIARKDSGVLRLNFGSGCAKNLVACAFQFFP